MKGIPGWPTLLIIAVMVSTGCNRHNESSGVQVQLGAPGADSEDTGYLALNIEKIYDKQQTLDKSPWHSDGGDWTFFECAPTKNPSTKILIGTRTQLSKNIGKAEIPVEWGEAVLAVDTAGVGAQFIETFAQAFHTPVPPTHGNKPPGVVRIRTAVLGSAMSRGPKGGFNQRAAGTWTATKWFLAGESDEVEVYFNFNLEEKRAEFSEKDEEYREDLVRAMVVGLRDGPLPERTPENDPTLTLVGPTVVNWVQIANTNETCQFFPKGGALAITSSEKLNHSKVFLASVEQPSERKLLAEFDGFAMVREFLMANDQPCLLISETFHKDQNSISSSDPQKFWTVDAQGKHPISLPAQATNWFAWDHALSPDGDFIAMHTWHTQPNKKRVRAIQLGNLKNNAWHSVELADTDVQLVGWQAGPIGIVLTGNDFGKAPRKPYSLDVAAGTLAPLDSIPAKFNPKLSPDQKHSIELIERDRLIITDVETGQKQEFVFNPLDRANARHEAIHWVNNRYLEFDCARPALIDLETLKMSFVTDKKSGFELAEFSPDFRFAFGYKDNAHYLGTVKLP